jgi:hypothetical protein
MPFLTLTLPIYPGLGPAFEYPQMAGFPAYYKQIINIPYMKNKKGFPSINRIAQVGQFK